MLILLNLCKVLFILISVPYFMTICVPYASKTERLFKLIDSVYKWGWLWHDSSNVGVISTCIPLSIAHKCLFAHLHALLFYYCFVIIVMYMMPSSSIIMYCYYLGHACKLFVSVACTYVQACLHLENYIMLYTCQINFVQVKTYPFSLCF